MSHLIKVMLPEFPNKKETIYFKGYIVSEQHEIVIYICEFNTQCSQVLNLHSCDKDIIYGLIGDEDSLTKTAKTIKVLRIRNSIIIEQQNTPKIKELFINGCKVYIKNCIITLYDYNGIKSSETINWTTDYISKLQCLVQNKQEQVQSNDNDAGSMSKNWLSSFMFAQHLVNYSKLVCWLFTTVRRDKKVSIKNGNLIVAIIIDVILGYFVLQLFMQDKQDLRAMLMSVLEKLVNLLYSLLKWLMGAPAGLKLNNAFNKMLGKYFSYHVQLWWLFIEVSGEKLDIILDVYHYLGYLGFSFQAAIISDMICIVTFHSYCIYVYAARLFNIQISGLVALLRLFVGRKYNPLRDGIDSCEYTNQELFVGTVAFTILLLLLPTTTMYYIVFTLFRLLSIVVQYTLAKLIYLVQTLPIYVVTLWLARSPKLAGFRNQMTFAGDGTLQLIEMRTSTNIIGNCSRHFNPECFVDGNLLRARLKENAVPTLNLPSKTDVVLIIDP